MRATKNIAVLDIESRKLVEDWSKPWDAGISVICVWVNWRGGGFGTFLFFGQDDLGKLVDVLKQAEVLVDFNGKRYDRPVIEHFLGRPIVCGETEHCDMMEHVKKELGHRLSCENVARATLGRGKSGHGSAAPAMWQSGNITGLHTYCAGDVAIERDLYFFGLRFGFLAYTDKDECLRQVPVNFGNNNRQPVKGIGSQKWREKGDAVRNPKWKGV